MIKHILYISALTATVFSMTSCLSDDGNYDYTPVRDITISGLSDSVRCVLQEPQALKPEIETDIPESNLEYCWRLGADTLAKTRDFNYTFTNVPTSSDPLTFDILDKTTNVRYSKVINLKVVSPFTTGWALLLNDGGKSKLDFQSLEGSSRLYDDVYGSVNGEQLSGTPVSVKQLVYNDGFTGKRTDRISVLMKGGKSPELDGVSMLRKKYYADEFHSTPVPEFAYISAENYKSDYALNIITTDGTIYGKAVGQMGTPDDGYYEYPYRADDKGYKVAPYVGSVSGQGVAIALDEANHRFVHWSPSTLSSKVSGIVFNEEESVKDADLESVPGTAVWIGNKEYNYDGNVYAVVNNGGKYYLYQLFFGYSSTARDFIYALKAKAEIPDGVVSNNSVFAIHPDTPYLFVGTGNSLKAINLNSLNEMSQAVNDLTTFDGDIKGMTFSRDNTVLPNLEFSIAVSRGGQSSILIVDPTLTSKGKILKRYNGIKGDIVSFCRKLM